MGTSQTHSILQTGISKLADFGETALNDISGLKAAVNTLTSDVHSLKQDLRSLMTGSNCQQCSPSGGPPSLPRATPDIVISEIFTLLKDEDYETAFNKALSLSRIDILNKIINLVDYSVLFATEPCPLSQSVLLSLLNQIGRLYEFVVLKRLFGLGCDLVTDTETKLEWIRGAVTHLDATPASPRVGTLTMGVLEYLITKTQGVLFVDHRFVTSLGMIKMGQLSGSVTVSAKMTLNMLLGARNSNLSP